MISYACFVGLISSDLVVVYCCVLRCVWFVWADLATWLLRFAFVLFAGDGVCFVACFELFWGCCLSMFVLVVVF